LTSGHVGENWRYQLVNCRGFGSSSQCFAINESTIEVRAAHFSLAQENGHSVASYEEIAQSSGDYRAIGSGAEAFEKAVAGQTISCESVLLALNRVIDEGTVDTVGGDIQYGTFNRNGSFTVWGIIRISDESADDGELRFGPAELRAI